MNISEIIFGYLQGTVAMEFLEQVPHLDAILIPVGGGGLVSGIAVAVAELNPKIKGFVFSALVSFILPIPSGWLLDERPIPVHSLQVNTIDRFFELLVLQ